MSLATRITNKINGAAKRVGPLETRSVYKRVLTETGGDPLIDRGVSKSTTDTIFSDQPLFSRVGNKAEILSTASVIVTPFDYQFLFTPLHMTYAQVIAKSVTLVLKDLQNHEEELELVTANPIVLNGVEAACVAVYRSVSR